MQFEVALGDIGLALAAISVITTLIGMFWSWRTEVRANRHATAMDAVANKLLPFYSLILQSIGRLDLYFMTADYVQYEDLQIDPSEFYEKAGNAFIYVREAESRKLVMRIIQILEGVNLLPSSAESTRVAAVLMKTFPLLIILKNHIEAYLEKYAEAMQIPNPDLSTLEEIRAAPDEDALKDVISALREK